LRTVVAKLIGALAVHVALLGTHRGRAFELLETVRAAERRLLDDDVVRGVLAGVVDELIVRRRDVGSARAVEVERLSLARVGDLVTALRAVEEIVEARHQRVSGLRPARDDDVVPWIRS